MPSSKLKHPPTPPAEALGILGCKLDLCSHASEIFFSGLMYYAFGGGCFGGHQKELDDDVEQNDAERHRFLVGIALHQLGQNAFYVNHRDEATLAFLRSYILTKRYSTHRVLRWKLDLDRPIIMHSLGFRVGALEAANRMFEEAKTMGIITALEAGIRLATIALGEGLRSKSKRSFDGERIMVEVAAEATLMGHPTSACDARLTLCILHFFRLDVDAFLLHSNEAWKTAVDADDVRRVMQAMGYRLLVATVLDGQSLSDVAAKEIPVAAEKSKWWCLSAYAVGVVLGMDGGRGVEE